MQKQPTKELVVSQVNKIIESKTPFLPNDEVEKFRAYSSKKRSIFQKSWRRPEGTEDRLASDISNEEEKEGRWIKKEEKLGKAKGSQPQSVSNTVEVQKIKDISL